jgi:hypothetical protein
MIGQCLSCTRTFAVAKTKRHWGICFQCITRRFAVVAARVEDHDPIDDYMEDIFRSSLSAGTERAKPIDWVNFNLVVSALSLEGVFSRFPQLLDAIGGLSGNAQSNGQAIYNLYQRNAEDVKAVLQTKNNEYYQQLLSGSLPSEKQPENEKSLQDQAGIILTAAGHEFERESPEFAFSIVKTRLDFSFPESQLFLEMKLLKESKERCPGCGWNHGRHSEIPEEMSGIKMPELAWRE